MVFKSFIGATCACLAVVSFNANAIPTEDDWLNAGDGLITYDANTGLEWLDITYTTSRSYNDVSSLFDAGEEFDGWRYATRAELSSLWDSFGGDGNYTGWSTGNNGLFDVMAPLIGDAYCAAYGCAVGSGYTGWITADAFSVDQHIAGLTYDAYWASPSITADYIDATWAVFHDADDSHLYLGSALVRATQVPEPSVMLLFSSGLLLIGVTRRKASL